MIKKCFACGVEKETTKLEIYPYQGEPDDHLTDEPIEPLLVVECEGADGFSGDDYWRACVVCHECYKKLQPDMWIGKHCWDSLNPITPHSQLPEILDDDDENGNHSEELYLKKWNAESY